MMTFRIHFYDGERHPLDVEAETPDQARQIAEERRSITAGQIKTVKRVREKVDG